MTFLPHTRVLIKIFVKGFYREHSGLFLFLFITVFTYCIFIEVLNKTHLTSDEIILNHLLFVLTMISSPVMMALVLLFWLFFTLKSWAYISQQMMVPSNQFLFYSSTSLDKKKQFQSWFAVQFVISLPMVGYGLFSLIVGILFNYYIAPAIILTFVVVLSVISSIVYVQRMNELINVNRKSLLSRITARWPKPFFSLFLYHLTHRHKLGLFITKLLSYAFIAGGAYLLEDVSNVLVASSIIVLGIVTTHSFLIYQSYRFENAELSFSLNFPYSKTRIYLYWLTNYLILTLPENIWLLFRFDFASSITLLLFNLGTGMLFRNILYSVSADRKKYLRWVFYLFAMFFLMILLNLLWLVVLVNLISSVILLNNKYYKQQAVIKS